MRFDVTSPRADELSVFPILQQLVGVETTLYGIVKIVEDVVKFFFTKKKIDLLYSEKSQALNDSKERLRKTDKKMKIERKELRKKIKQLTYECRLLKTQQTHFKKHFFFICIGIIRATPLVGTIYSTYAGAYKNVPLVDKLCVLPVVQQLIGGCGVLYSIALLTHDIWKKFNNEVIEDVQNEIEITSNFIENRRLVKEYGDCMLVELPTESVTDEELNAKLMRLKKIQSRYKKNHRNFKANLELFYLNVARCIPIAGTLYSCGRWYHIHHRTFTNPTKSTE